MNIHHHDDAPRFTAKEQAVFDSFVAVIRARHESRHTAAVYGSSVVAFYRWLQARPEMAAQSSEDKVAAYLSHIAPHCAAKTQNQKLCAIVRYYRDVLRRPLGELPAWTYAKVPRRLPTCLNHDEIRRFLALVDGTVGLMCRLTYGAGLRLMEITSLRVQDVDLAQQLVTIRGGKGDKDRTVPLPVSLVGPIGEHLQRVRALWEADAARGTPPVYLPNGLERKYPNAGKDWRWFWVFPGRDLSRDPETGIARRHHATRNCMQKAVTRAARLAAIAKRVCVHTLRHTFATHQLQRGVNIRQLAALMGHNSIETTQIYLHCLPAEINRAGSPLDDMAGPVVVAFATAHPPPARAARVS